MQAKLIIRFESLSDAKFLGAVEVIAGGITNNTNFPVPWPSSVQSPAAFAADVATYQLTYTAASGGDTAKVAARKTARKALTGQAKKIASYLEIVADGNVAALATTGFALRRDVVKSTTQDPPSTLADFKVTRTALSGGLLVHARADRRVDVYNVQTATADPSVEANWTDAGTFKHCNRIELTGLTVNKVYYVRIRGFNKNGHGVWTTSAGILVI